MAADPLKIWANTVVTDPLTNSDQVRTITEEEYQDGWLRQASISAQQLNSLFNLLSLYSCPTPSPMWLMSTSLVVPDEALEMDGVTTVDATNNPNAFAAWGSPLPDMSADAPAGSRYVIRNN